MKKIFYISCLAFAVISCKDISNKIEEIAQENQDTIKADAAPAQEEITAPQAETEEEKQTRLWMEKSEGKWTYTNEIGLKLYKPTKEGNTITGEFEEHADTHMNLSKYERSANGEFNITYYKMIYNDGREEPIVDERKYKIQLDDDGNTLTVIYNLHTDSEFKMIYTRK